MDLYIFGKILHLISIISWMAGLLYLPRIFVYHTQVKNDSETDKIFQIMERRLYKYIMNPAMILSLLTGIYLISQIGLSQGWLHAKITFILILIGFHHMLGKYRKDFIAQNNKHSEKFFRYINEVPTIIMIIIVTLAISKPF